MFDIGFSELLLIAIVALVVLGPERLPKAARFRRPVGTACAFAVGFGQAGTRARA